MFDWFDWLESLLYHRPEGGETTRWLGGIFLPIPFLIYGLLCIVNRAGAFPRRHMAAFQFEGMNAVVLGIGFLSVAVYLHCYFFLALSENEETQEYSVIGRGICVGVFALSFAWMMWALWQSIAGA